MLPQVVTNASRDGLYEGRTDEEVPLGATAAQHVLGMSSCGTCDPCFRVRLELPARALSPHGIATDLLPLFSKEQAIAFREAGVVGKTLVLANARTRLRRRLNEMDDQAGTVVVQRQVDLTPLLALEKAVVTGRRLIYDVDDAIWLSGRQTGGHPMGVLKGTSRKVRWLAERSEHVIAGNQILAEHLGKYSRHVTVIPSLVEPAANAIRGHQQGDSVTLGWIGSPTTAPYLRRIVPVLERFAKQSARPVRLVVVGGAAPQVAGVDVHERAWSVEMERQLLAEIDIGLMPLDDTPWSRGKCAYKALQYMACAIPSVVDDVGISAATVGGAGHVARNAVDWLEGLQALAEDVGLRTRLGMIGRERVEREFSPQRWMPTLARILRGE